MKLSLLVPGSDIASRKPFLVISTGQPGSASSLWVECPWA
jgi:hypothetical protein